MLGSPFGGTITITTLGQLSVDEVADEGLDTIVGSTLSELDSADNEGDSWELAGNSPKGVSLFFGRGVDVLSDSNTILIGNNDGPFAINVDVGIRAQNDLGVCSDVLCWVMLAKCITSDTWYY